MSSYMQFSVFIIYHDPLKSLYYTFMMVFIFQLQRIVFLRILSQYKEEFYKETAFHVDLQHVCQHSNNND